MDKWNQIPHQAKTVKKSQNAVLIGIAACAGYRLFLKGKSLAEAVLTEPSFVRLYGVEKSSTKSNVKNTTSKPYENIIEAEFLANIFVWVGGYKCFDECRTHVVGK